MKSTSISTCVTRELATKLENRVTGLPVSISGFLKMLILTVMQLNEEQFRALIKHTPSEIASFLAAGV